MQQQDYPQLITYSFKGISSIYKAKGTIGRSCDVIYDEENGRDKGGGDFSNSDDAMTQHTH